MGRMTVAEKWQSDEMQQTRNELQLPEKRNAPAKMIHW